MKESKLSKEVTQHIFILVVVYFVMIFGATIFIQNFYVDFKLNKLQVFFEQNEATLTENELITYADEQGFTYTIKSKSDVEEEALDAILDPNSNFSDYTEFLQMFNRIAGNQSTPENAEHHFEAKFNGQTEMVTFATRDNLITLSLNASITNDIVIITMAIATFTTLIFLAMLISVNMFINKRVGRPLDKLVSYIDDIANLESNQDLTFTHDDEIAKIGTALMSMEHDLNREIVNRNELLRAVTHELKTPLAHIVTLMYLHKSQVGEYADFEVVNDQVQNIISENNELIQVTLNSLTATDKLKQEFNIKPFIESKIKMFDVYLNEKNVELELDSYEFTANPVPLNLVFNNLLLNASKYSKSFLKVTNDGSIVTISNDFTDNAGSGVGKTIISRLSEFENYTIEVTGQDGVYSTTIKLNT
ncbi:hypothetical protein R2F61_04130 [Mollicutes bacterium LVI A0078]|nr:hypothetical protein RZE84_04150 [Mollicutes bacterium LVI A0075]WOO91750.1 hypothetical protein R2F61_04130 [Mollicutes bacterium LVI A0078]